jgi:initiation factor 1A
MGRQKNKKNPKGGKKHKAKASKNYKTNVDINRIPFKDKSEGQQYAQVINRLGGNRLNLQNELGLEIQGVIPGRFRKKVWFCSGDTIIVQTREFNENEYDIIYRYSEDEVKILKKSGHLNCFSKSTDDNENESYIDFTEKVDDDDDVELLSTSFEDVLLDKKQSSKKSLDIDFDDI